MLGIGKRITTLHEEVLSRGGEVQISEPKKWIFISSVILLFLLLGMYTLLESRVSSLQSKVDSLSELGSKLEAFEKTMPQKVKQVFLQNDLARISQQLSVVGLQVESEEQKAVLKQIDELMMQLQKDVGK